MQLCLATISQRSVVAALKQRNNCKWQKGLLDKHTVISLKKTMPQIVAMRAGQVVMIGKVTGSPSAALATNQADCAVPHRAPLARAGTMALLCGIQGLFLFPIE